jgi:hypothetical protein
MVRVRFQSSCPACQNVNFYYWIHSGCGGDLYLDNRAMLICDDCNREDYIFRWKFDCGNRDNGAHKGGFEYGCLQGFLACLSNLGKLQNPPGNFIVEVMSILMQHKNEFTQNY